MQGGTDNVMTQKGELAAVIHQFDKDAELKAIYDGKKTEPFLKDWEETRKKLGK